MAADRSGKPPDTPMLSPQLIPAQSPRAGPLTSEGRISAARTWGEGGERAGNEHETKLPPCLSVLQITMKHFFFVFQRE